MRPLESFPGVFKEQQCMLLREVHANKIRDQALLTLLERFKRLELVTNKM